MPINKLSAPFPWFGGKSKVAEDVWNAIGDVPNYVEPFFGSGAVLFGRPTEPGIETVNDKDGFVSNFFRSVQNDPEQTAFHADWPVNENDLHARHIHLVDSKRDFVQRLEGDPHYYDCKIAGWWVWGVCATIAGSWCIGNGSWQQIEGKLTKIKRGGKGINRCIPAIGGGYRGIGRSKPHVSSAGQGIHTANATIYEWFESLSRRLRRVRVCCGDFERVLTHSPTINIGMTGIFLDPPYGDVGRADCYAFEDKAVASRVNEWCVDNGDSDLLRIVLCGYDGEHNNLEELGWNKIKWKARGGYAAGKGNDGDGNEYRERLWLSPSCEYTKIQLTMF